MSTFAWIGIFNSSILPLCWNDSQCNNNYNCSGIPFGSCVYGCNGENSNCRKPNPEHPNRKYCDKDKCVECTKNANCTFDKDKKYCAKNECVECTENNNCPIGKICKANKCEPGCDNDEHCPLGQICTNYSCVDGCRTDMQPNPRCPNTTPNCYLGHCRVACNRVEDCGIGEICRKHSCVPGSELERKGLEERSS